MVLFFGALFSAFSDASRKGTIFSDPFFWRGLVFTTIFNVFVFYGIVYYPDWMTLYFVRSGWQSPLAIVFLFSFLYYFPYVLGFYLGKDFKKIAPLCLFTFMVLMLTIKVLLMVYLYNRFAVVGSQLDFLASRGVPFFSLVNPLLPILLGTFGAMLLYLLLVIVLDKRIKKTHA